MRLLQLTRWLLKARLATLVLQKILDLFALVSIRNLRAPLLLTGLSLVCTGTVRSFTCLQACRQSMRRWPQVRSVLLPARLKPQLLPTRNLCLCTMLKWGWTLLWNPYRTRHSASGRLPQSPMRVWKTLATTLLPAGLHSTLCPRWLAMCSTLLLQLLQWLDLCYRLVDRSAGTSMGTRFVCRRLLRMTRLIWCRIPRFSGS